MMIGGLAINGIVTTAMKYGFNRDRPFTSYSDIVKLTGGGSPSFPSGHTSLAFSVATSVSIAYPKWYVIAPSFLWASAVGYSRMHLGVHYPSDVFVGALVGSGSAWLGQIITKKIQQKRSTKGLRL
jgi:membrane-associated phospholipid phosphatase